MTWNPGYRKRDQVYITISGTDTYEPVRLYIGVDMLVSGAVVAANNMIRRDFRLDSPFWQIMQPVFDLMKEPIPSTERYPSYRLIISREEFASIMGEELASSLSQRGSSDEQMRAG